MACFGNMSTYAPTWSLGNAARILKYRHLPDAATYDRVRTFARTLIADIGAGKIAEVEKEVGMDEVMRHLPARWAAKLMTGKHTIDAHTCIGCGTCRAGCPTGAIDPDRHRVDTDRCIACMGCVNNCPGGSRGHGIFGEKKCTAFKPFWKNTTLPLKNPPYEIENKISRRPDPRRRRDGAFFSTTTILPSKSTVTT